MGGQPDFEQFMNSFADSIFNGSSTFGAVGTSMVNGIKVSGITIEDKSNYSASNTSSSDDEENTQLTVSLTPSVATIIIVIVIVIVIVQFQL